MPTVTDEVEEAEMEEEEEDENEGDPGNRDVGDVACVSRTELKIANQALEMKKNNKVIKELVGRLRGGVAMLSGPYENETQKVKLDIFSQTAGTDAANLTSHPKAKHRTDIELATEDVKPKLKVKDKTNLCGMKVVGGRSDCVKMFRPEVCHLGRPDQSNPWARKSGGENPGA